MTDKRARELGYIDVTFVNLTAQREREARRFVAIRWAAIVLAGIAGFLLFPMMVLWETGDNLFVNLYEWGNPYLAGIVLLTLAIVGGFAGFVTHHFTSRD